MSVTAADLAWAAGFLEGEGCWPRAGALTVTACQVQRWPLERLQALVGGTIRDKGINRNPRARPSFVWSIYGAPAAAVSMSVYKLMSPVRQQRIREALTQWRPKPVDAAMRHTCGRGHPLLPLLTKNGRQNRSRRKCMICVRARGRAKHHRLKAINPDYNKTPRRCAQCGVEFLAVSKKSVTCSWSCRNRFFGYGLRRKSA